MASKPERTSPAYGEGREALLRAVITVTARSGLRGLTYRAVAEEAGVAHGLVRFHFGSRDALIVAATQYTLQESIDIGELSSDEHSVGNFGSAISKIVLTDTDLMAFQYEVILESRRRPELQPVVEELYAALRGTTISDLGQRGLPSSTGLGYVIFAALDGLVLQGLALDDLEPIEEALTALRQLMQLAAEHPEAFDAKPARAKKK